MRARDCRSSSAADRSSPARSSCVTVFDTTLRLATALASGSAHSDGMLIAVLRLGGAFDQECLLPREGGAL
jgi:hypothetical protein